MKVLFITNIPVPYRIDFYNELGKYVDLTVLFEAKGASDQGIKFNWNLDKINNFKAIFLSDGDIKEKKIDWSIFKHVKKNKYDKIVVTSYSYFTEMALLLYLKLRRIPYFMETDGGIIRNENPIKRFYKRFLVSGAQGYFSPSKSSDDYLEFYGANKSVIYRYPFTSLSEENILNTPLTPTDKKVIKKKIGVSEEKMLLGVGQFIHRKGWDILIKAAESLPDNTGIYIIGGKATEEYISLRNNLGLENKIHFLDFMKSEELTEYYKAADLFVLPTREDIWGLVINEAMAYGLPVITTDKCVSGLELVSNKNGSLITTDNVCVLADAINNIINNNNILKRMSMESLDIIKNYTIENMAKTHSDVFIK